MTRSTSRTALLPTIVLGLVALLCVLVVAEASAAGAGPVTASCGKFKKKAQKVRCQKGDQANSRFVGVRGDGEEIDAIYCANGKFEDRSTGYYGTGISNAAEDCATLAV